MFFHLPILSFLIWLPLLGAVLVLMTGNDTVSRVGLLLSWFGLSFALHSTHSFDPSTYFMQSGRSSGLNL